MANRLALFDCDGTLVDSQHNICTAMDRAFEAVKLAPPPRHHTLAVVGLSLPQAMAVLLPDAEADFHMHLADQYKLMRSEEHTSELQSLMRISYAVFCLKNK